MGSLKKEETLMHEDTCMVAGKIPRHAANKASMWKRKELKSYEYKKIHQRRTRNDHPL